MRRFVSQLRAVLVGAALSLSEGSCSRANLDYCAPDTPCPKDRRCVPAPNLDTGEGTCVPIVDLGGAGRAHAGIGIPVRRLACRQRCPAALQRRRAAGLSA